MTFKKYLPRSLFGRSVLILVAPIVLLQAVVAYIFVQRHFEGVTEQMTDSVARELRYIVAQVETADSIADVEQRLQSLGRPFDIQLGLDEGAALAPKVSVNMFDFTGSVVVQTIRREIRQPVALDLTTYRKDVDIRIETNRGVLRALTPRRRLIAAKPHVLLVWMLATAMALLSIAVPFLRNQIRPIRQLAEAADAFGKGRVSPFHPSGAEEVRRAGAAFLDMRSRIERQMEQRTKMLSGVSHDLRTPLTRMKLALAMAEQTPENADLRRDVSEMEHMLAEFLAFARGEQGEAPQEVDLLELIEELAENARRRGTKITVASRLETPTAVTALMRRRAMKRCLQNLIDNAAAYGEHVALSLTMLPKMIECAVEDDGPGIPPALRSDAFKAFTRLDEARNQDRSSGVGLGLSIALDIARSHGGDITLGASEPLGGLRAAMRLPR